MHEGTLASARGDEGSWSYRYGEFSKDFSVYQINYAAGDGLDTSDFSTELINFN